MKFRASILTLTLYVPATFYSQGNSLGQCMQSERKGHSKISQDPIGSRISVSTTRAQITVQFRRCGAHIHTHTHTHTHTRARARARAYHPLATFNGRANS